MPTLKSIPVADLLIDTINPRIGEEPPNQREAIRAVAVLQKEKLIRLAEDIVQHGLNPSDSPIVIPAPEQPGRYVVLEGNRRLSALKALENPELLTGAIEEKIVKRFRKLSERYLINAVTNVDCVVFQERPSADHWIELRHTGQNEGAGIVSWGALETARFRERRGESVYYLQALDFLEDRGDLNPEERREVPVTSLERLLSNPDIRARLGLEMRNRILYTQFDEDEVAKGLSYVVKDLASGRVKTGQIYHLEDRLKYINAIDDSNLPDTSQPIGELTPLVASSEDRQTSTEKRKKSRPSSKGRGSLIPRGYILEIDPPRINEIYHELKNLSVAKFSNAVAVLFRVFLELSVDDYIKSKSLAITEDRALRLKLEKAGEDLANKGKLDAQQLKAVRRASQADTLLAASITTFNQYVHNPYFAPAPSDLLAAWDNLVPCIEAMWDGS